MKRTLSYSITLFLVILLAITVQGLHLQTAALYVDNLEQSNLNYYFSTMSPSSFYANINQFRVNNPSAQSCPPSFPYANYTNNNISCFACDPLTNNSNLKTSKVLFNVLTRKCEECSINKTEICNKILNGTFVPPNTQTNTIASGGTQGATAQPQTNAATAPTPNTTTTQNNPAPTPSTTTTQSNPAPNPAPATTTITTTNTAPNSQPTPAPATTTTNTISNSQPAPSSTTSSTIPAKITPGQANTTNPTPTSNTANTSPSTTNTNNNMTASNTTPTTNTQNISPTTSNQTINPSSTTVAPAINANGCAPSRPLLNKATGLCEPCPEGTEFVNSKLTCQPSLYATSPIAPNLILSNQSELVDLNREKQKQNPQQVIQYCPADKPYASKNTCINCDKAQYFYVATGACVTGCPEGTYYDSNVLACSPALYYSDVNAPWLVSQLGNYQSWKAKIENMAKSSPRMIVCSNNKPYEVNGTCITCPSGTYFYIDLNKCLPCGKNRYYEPSQRKCLGIVEYRHSMKTYASSVI